MKLSLLSMLRLISLIMAGLFAGATVFMLCKGLLTGTLAAVALMLAWLLAALLSDNIALRGKVQQHILQGQSAKKDS